MSNYNINFLNLPLNTLTNIKYSPPTSIDGCSVTIIKADTLRKDFYVCDKCGSVHKHTIKEYKPIFNKFSTHDNSIVILNINKKRFVCHNCHKTFTETIPSIDKHARISNKLKKAIADEFIVAKSNKDIAIKFFVSQSTISRLSFMMDEHIDSINYNYLPTNLGIDEFKASYKSMACLLVDHDTKKPFDILPSRKTIDLDKYFSMFSKDALDSVKTVTMDMYDPYVLLVKKHFKNATIVFDKFHIVQNFSRALNKTRITFMNTLSTNSIEYKRLKKYWKSLLSLTIEQSLHYYSMPCFNYKTNLSDIVYTIKNYDDTLSKSYDFYQLFFYHLNNCNFKLAFSIIEAYKDKVSDKMKTAINTFLKYKEYCLEAYKSSYSNALTESMIQKIKLIKRNAFGYNSFMSFKRRILHYYATKLLRDNLTRLPKIKNIRLHIQNINDNTFYNYT
ncbi:transposase [Bacilli bacterium PM5-3]|nr:transposase [Bacilli bacterium PM5-3]